MMDSAWPGAAGILGVMSILVAAFHQLSVSVPDTLCVLRRRSYRATRPEGRSVGLVQASVTKPAEADSVLRASNDVTSTTNEARRTAQSLLRGSPIRPSLGCSTQV